MTSLQALAFKTTYFSYYIFSPFIDIVAILLNQPEPFEPTVIYQTI